MRRTTTLALLAALAVAGWIALFERGEPESAGDEAVFGVDPAEVLVIGIGRPEGSSGEAGVRLAREAQGGFLVSKLPLGVLPPEDPPDDELPIGRSPLPEAQRQATDSVPADAAEVDLLLQNLTSLRFEREIPDVPEADLPAFGLAPPGLSLRIVTPSSSKTVGFGNETPAPGNRYLRFGDSVFVVPAFARDNFDKSAWELRDKRIFRLETALSRRLRLTAEEETVELAREAGVWRILRPFRFAADPYEASRLAGRLLDAAMTGLAPGPGESPGEGQAPDRFGLAAPRLTAELDLAGPEETAVSRTLHFGSESRTPPGVFARLASDPQVFVLPAPLFEELLGSAADGLAGVRSLRLFRFAAFRAVELRILAPDGEAVFRRRDGEEGREWTLALDGADPTVADAGAVEDLLYELNSTDAESLGGPDLPAEGARWTITVREEESEGFEGPAETGPESVRFTVLASGEAQALRTDDARTLLLTAAGWEEIARRFTAARGSVLLPAPPEVPAPPKVPAPPEP